MDTFFEVLPGRGIQMICDNFTDLELANESDEFLGLICEVLILWKRNPTADISSLINYLEEIEFRDSVELVLEFYYDLWI